jgi:ribonuclease HI
MHGSIEHTTSNRAEVCAMLAALACVNEGVHLGVQSDSRYVVDHVRAGCRANDNLDLWSEVRELVVAKGIMLSASWVQGHNGHSHNERVDALAGGRRRSSSRMAFARAR